MRSIMSSPLTLHTRSTAAPNTFETFWTTGRKQGVITTTISDKYRQDVPVIAELSVLHYLLSHKEILGSGRAGNGMDIAVTFGAIRKLAKLASDKKHLGEHARFLAARYADATISVSKDNSWVDLTRADSKREDLLIEEPLPEVVRVSGIGKVALSFHIIERMMARANYASVGAAWRHLCDMLGSSNVSEVRLPPGMAEHKARKHGSVGKHLRVGNEPWRFVIGYGNHSHQTGMPMLVTAYVRV